MTPKIVVALPAFPLTRNRPMTLTSEEHAFLKQQTISPLRVLEVSGMIA
jgi:hypothetical protein